MAAVNYFIGVKRGAPLNVHNVVAGTTSAGTAVDVEVRMQINDGVNATGLSKKDTVIALEILEAFVDGNGMNHNGSNLPAI